MPKELIVSSTSLETKLALLEDDVVTEIFLERTKSQGILGNIYKGKVTKVLPGMQAAFVDIGLDRDGFLYVADFLEDLDRYEELFEKEEVTVASPKKVAAGKRRSSRRRSGARSTTKEGPDEPVKKESSPKAAASGRRKSSQTERLRRSKRGSRGGDYSAPTTRLPQHLQSGLPPQTEEQDPELPNSRLPARLEPSFPVARPQAASRKEATLEEPSHRPRLAKGGSSKGRRRINHEGLIGNLLRKGQEILVQVAKEPIGKKGARITSHVALPGRYLVFMPTVDHVGVSRRITAKEERARLRETVLRLRGDFCKGFIVRTVGNDQPEKDFSNDMKYLTQLWEAVKKKAEQAAAPALIHSEPSLVERVIRDRFSKDFRAIRVDDEQAHARVVEFVGNFNRQLVKRVQLYNRHKPIFDEYGVSQEVEKALKHKVWLKNGGYIVINQTEALVAIDVNTGRFVGRTNSLEETITKTNLAAVQEVVRQIRLRDLGGIIIIDFIDMNEARNRQRVMEVLQQELSKDNSPSNILHFNEFGLVAITRKRVKQSLEKALCQPCIYCAGTGMTKSVRTVAYSIHQEVRLMAPHLGEGREITIRCHPDLAEALRDREREVLSEIEEMTGKVVSLKSDSQMHIEQFDLVES